MYNRKYSLKTRYNFNKVKKYGNNFHTEHLIIRYLSVAPDVFAKEIESEAESESEVEVKAENKNTTAEIVDKKFAVIVSNRFSKKAVVQNRTKRVISEAIRLRLDKFTPNCYYIFIPKKNCLVKDKPVIHVDEIITEIDTFLSEVVIV